MDGHPPFVVEDQHDDLENIAGVVRSDDEKAVRRIVVAEVVDYELVFDGVMDVVIRATVLACRRVDLHEEQL